VLSGADDTRWVFAILVWVTTVARKLHSINFPSLLTMSPSFLGVPFVRNSHDRGLDHERNMLRPPTLIKANAIGRLGICGHAGVCQAMATNVMHVRKQKPYDCEGVLQRTVQLHGHKKRPLKHLKIGIKFLVSWFKSCMEFQYRIDRVFVYQIRHSFEDITRLGSLSNVVIGRSNGVGKSTEPIK
jgi:hypothetical protein